MRTDEFLAKVSEISKTDALGFETVRDCLPLGVDSANTVVAAHRENMVERYHHTCVTGGMRGEFISRLVLTLACLYEKTEAAFLIVSPDLSYGKLMKLAAADITVPFITNKADVAAVLSTVQELARMRITKRRYPKLFVVLDGLETLDDEDRANTLDCYRPFFEAVGTTGIEIITGVELTKTVFAGYPGAFVGIGNCLVTPSVGGEADITYVGADASMTMPKKFTYPSSPEIENSIEFFNGIL
ncbi:MAG: hypothetical protein IJX98_02670 [Clostridia bacterium]|nr:hypothetical protein [Clostridia bacterium]